MNEHAPELSGLPTAWDAAGAEHSIVVRLTEDVLRLQSEIADLRILDRQRQALLADLRAQRDGPYARPAGPNPAASASGGLPPGRLLGPFRAAAARQPWLARQITRAVRIAWWTLTLQVHRRLPELLHERRVALAETARRRVEQEPAEGWRPVPGEPTLVAGVLKERFWALQSFPTYRAPGLPPRLTLVTDSINSGSLYGGVATAIIFAVELAKASRRKLRILTRTELPHRENVQHVLDIAGIAYRDDIEFCCSGPGSRREIDIGEDEVFVTTSWWTTSSSLKVLPAERIVYLLQEDEREFYPAGDDQLRCAETLRDPRIRIVTNTKLLADHLAGDGFTNIARNGLWFEPAFPPASYYYAPARAPKLNFFFYARPMNLRNLFYRGIEVIGEAVDQGILDPAEWQIHFVGKDLNPAWADLSFRPILRQNLVWSDYAALVRRMDLGLSLMYTPHPSYPPLDLAACGSVVVTNRHGPKQDLDRFSKNIICADSDAASLLAALRQGAALARDPERRLANHLASTFSRDWSASMRGAVASLSGQLCS